MNCLPLDASEMVFSPKEGLARNIRTTAGRKTRGKKIGRVFVLLPRPQRAGRACLNVARLSQETKRLCIYTQ